MSNRGLLFLSHWSGDAQTVRMLLERLDQGRAFIDVRCFEPGSSNLQEMKDAITESDLFVFVISPRTPSDCFSFFEAALAEREKASRSELEVLVWPIEGATYRDAPLWMRQYFSIPPEFTISDVARQIRRSSEKVLIADKSMTLPPYQGREGLERKCFLEINSKAHTTGLSINSIILYGLPGIGRTSLARHLSKKAFPAKRGIITEFALSDAGDAIDLYLGLLADLEGPLSVDRISKLTSAFPSHPKEQAGLIAQCMKHWGVINQALIIKIRWSLRDRGRGLQPWFAALLEALAKNPDVVVFFISGRKLPPESLVPFRQVAHFEVEKLDDDAIAYVLTELIDAKLFNPGLVQRLAKLCLGHPETAHHVAYLVNKGRSAETLLSHPELIYSFQDKVLEELFGLDVLDKTALNVLSILCWFPEISFALLANIFSHVSEPDLVAILWELSDYCLIELSQNGAYRLPNIVRSTFMRRMPPLDPALQSKTTAALRALIQSDNLAPEQIEPIVLAFTTDSVDIPEQLRAAITAGTLASIVEQHYERGKSSSDHAIVERSFATAARLSELAVGLNAADDTVENILFQGADSLARSGLDPEPIVSKMLARGYSSALYARGSYRFHKLHDLPAAISDLKAVQASGKFRLRAIRLLARIYLRNRDPQRALDELDKVKPHELARDSGFLAMKIKALRALRRHAEADDLEADLRTLSDDYGEILIFEAVRELKRKRYQEARSYMEAARLKPKANGLTLTFLGCIIDLNEGHTTSLAAACALAESMGRSDDALQLRARAALLVDRDWRRAEGELSKVQHRTWFDWQLEIEMLKMKRLDPVIARDAAALADLQAREEETARQIASALDVFE